MNFRFCDGERLIVFYHKPNGKLFTLIITLFKKYKKYLSQCSRVENLVMFQVTINKLFNAVISFSNFALKI